MPEDLGLGLLPSVIEVANAEELMTLLGDTLSCHITTLSEWLDGDCHRYQIMKGFGSEFEGLHCA